MRQSPPEFRRGRLEYMSHELYRKWHDALRPVARWKTGETEQDLWPRDLGCSGLENGYRAVTVWVCPGQARFSEIALRCSRTEYVQTSSRKDVGCREARLVSSGQTWDAGAWNVHVRDDTFSFKRRLANSNPRRYLEVCLQAYANLIWTTACYTQYASS